MVDSTDDVNPVSPFERATQRAVADEGQRALAALLERAREAEDVLALGEPAEAEKRRAVPARAQRPACRFGIARSEALEVDAAVDHLGLAAGVGQSLLELGAQPRGDGDHRGCSPDDVPGRAAHAGLRADVRDVLAVRGDDERRARRECSGETCRYEEVRVGDLRIEAPRRASGISEQLQVPTRPARARVDDRALDLVPAGDELVLEVRDEDAEVRVARTRVHLRDEEDPQRATRA